MYGSLLPERYFPSYHWINVAVSPDPTGRLNPLHTILKQFEEDDLILVKLDIDTPGIEISLAHQLLGDDTYADLVDQFYFEHHVHIGEMAPHWKKKVNGSIQDTLELFSKLREKGIPSHYWP